MRARVTFLLTEVLDSVRRWEADESGMAAAAARLDDIVRRLTAKHRGVQVKPRGEGDSHFLVFDDPVDAVTCAVALQRAVANEPMLAVRSGCNIGDADLRDGDWYGTTVNRCARLRAAAHGRQALVSAEVAAALATAAAADGARPSWSSFGIALRSLGHHRLKDLDEVVEIFQLVADGLVTDHPPLATQPRSHGLALSGTSFVGRSGDVERVLDVLARGRWATLVGAPGVGTTRLALESAAAWWAADGRPVRSVRDPAGWDAMKSAELAGGGLVVIDDADQLVSGSAGNDSPVSEPVVATARGPLGLAGEVTLRVAPLNPLEAERLLRDRLPDDVAISPGLVTYADGLPLAIELLARRAASIDAATLAARLADDPLAVLGGDRRAEPARHASMRAALQAAFDHLDAGTKADLLAAWPGHPKWVAVGWHEPGGPLPLIAGFLGQQVQAIDPSDAP